MQDVTRVRPASEGFFAGLAVSMWTGSQDLFWRSSSFEPVSTNPGGFWCFLGLFYSRFLFIVESSEPVSTNPEFLVLFEAVLLQALVHPWYLSHPSLYQLTLGFLELFGVVFLQVLFIA